MYGISLIIYSKNIHNDAEYTLPDHSNGADSLISGDKYHFFMLKEQILEIFVRNL